MPKIYRSIDEALTGSDTVISFYCMKCGKEKSSALGRFCKKCQRRMKKQVENTDEETR